jgi:hypothetical protein
LKAFPKDSDGSAKIALIAMDRSLSAWAGLREALGDNPDSVPGFAGAPRSHPPRDGKSFPEARAFVRPGFDEHKGVAARP